MEEPRIESIETMKLVGKKLRMSFANNKTPELWQSFMPQRAEIKNPVGAELFSVEVYDGTDFFYKFDPTREFEKWAATRVSDFNLVPDEMETLIIPRGEYAVFSYKGKPSEAQGTYQHIYGSWLPQSQFTLDSRPHFSVMGEKYKGEHTDSEEEIWIPVMEKWTDRGVSPRL